MRLATLASLPFAFSLAMTAAGTSLLACATEPTDELAGETAEDRAGDGKADGAVDGTYTYFAIRGDLRRCAEPECGGFFLERLNRSTTVCHDGAAAEACYTPELDWTEADLSEATQALLRTAAEAGALTDGVTAIVRGRFAPRSTGKVEPQLGRFIVTEAWTAKSGTESDGVFVKVKDNGVRCIASPCESLGEKALNSSRTAAIAAIDYSLAEIGDAQASALAQDMYTAGGIIIAGDRYTHREAGRTARGRTATAAYQRLVDRSSGGCFIGGCSGQICSGYEGVVTTCEWREEYACYQTATCERQADGDCAWTQTGELQACLGN